MTHRSLPTSSTTQGFPSSGPPWQECDLHQAGNGGSQLFPPPQCSGEWPSSPSASRVPPGPPENHPVNRPTSSSLTAPPQPPSGPPVRHAISLRTKGLQPLVDQWKIDVAGIVDLPPFLEMCYIKYDEADESDNLSDLGGAEGEPTISLKQTKFSLKQFAKRMGQANYSAFNKWKKV